MATTEFQLTRNASGRLVLIKPDGKIHEGVFPVRAFPLTLPNENIAIVGVDGHEVAWIDRLSELSEAVRKTVNDELDGRQIMPEIQTILRATSSVTPSSWHVITDRGETSFVLLEKEDIRSIGAHSFVVVDSHGIHFLIRDLLALDKNSLKILEHFY